MGGVAAAGTWVSNAAELPRDRVAERYLLIHKTGSYYLRNLAGGPRLRLTRRRCYTTLLLSYRDLGHYHQ
jgi:hypothetical protein